MPWGLPPTHCPGNSAEEPPHPLGVVDRVLQEGVFLELLELVVEGEHATLALGIANIFLLFFLVAFLRL